jgi:hypothetical protein
VIVGRGGGLGAPQKEEHNAVYTEVPDLENLEASSFLGLAASAL